MTMRITTKLRIATAVFAAATLLHSIVLTTVKSAVQPQPLYATAEFGTKLVAIDLEAKTVSTIGGTGFPFSLSLGFCPPGGVVPFTITNTFDPNNAQLATLNLATGAAAPVGSPLPTGQTLDIMGMTCSRDGTLYAVGQFDTSNPDFNSLYIVNRKTGVASRVGSTGVKLSSTEDPAGGFGFLMALAFAPDGTLYGANDVALYRIDISSGYASKIVDFVGVTAPPSVMGLAIDSRRNFYIADFEPMPPGSRIYQVDTTTGVATPILNTELGFVHNIAFRVPF
jgi:hypothetical protein